MALTLRVMPVSFFCGSYINQAVFLELNHLSQSVAPSIWVLLSNAGDGFFAMALATVLFAAHPERMKLVVVSGIMALLIVHIMKYLFDVSRPPAVLAADVFHIIGPAYKRGSFPSGHAATAFLMAGIVWHCCRATPIRATVMLLAALSAFSRVAVGVHWPFDVLVGAGLGLLCVGASIRMCKLTGERRPSDRSNHLSAVLCASLGGCFSVALFFRKTGMETYFLGGLCQYLLALCGLFVCFGILRKKLALAWASWHFSFCLKGLKIRPFGKRTKL